MAVMSNRLRAKHANLPPMTPEPRPKIPTETLAEALDDWLSDAASAGRTDKTLEVYRGYARRLVAWHRKAGRDCDAASLRAFFAELVHLKPVSLRHFQDVVHIALTWGVGQEYWPASPMDRVTRQDKGDPAPIEAFSSEQLQALLAAARQGVNGRRNLALLWVMIDTGLRRHEVCAITAEAITWEPEGGKIRVTGKGKKVRIVPFGPTTRAALRAQLRHERIETGPVFRATRGAGKGSALSPATLWQLFRQWGKTAGVTGVRCSPHTVRHATAILALENGANFREVQTLLGHARPDQTARYTHISPERLGRGHARWSVAEGLRKKKG